MNPSQSTTAGEHLLDSKAAAAFLGCSEWSLAEWRCTGAGPQFVRVGRLIRYTPGALQAWIERNTFSSTSAADMKAAG